MMISEAIRGRFAYPANELSMGKDE